MDAATSSHDSLQNSTPSLRPPSRPQASDRDHSGNYLQALLVQDQERRNAVNPRNRWASRPGRCSAFSPRPGGPMRQSNRAVAGILGPQAGTPGGGVGVRWHRLPQAGQEIGGCGPAVLRQARARWPTARVGCSWPTAARWAGRWWTSYLYLPKSWTLRPGPVCCFPGVPEDRRNYPSKTEFLADAGAGPGLGYLRAEWVAGAGRTPSGWSPGPSGRDCAALGMRYVLDIPGRTTVWPLDPAWTRSGISGVRPPPQTQAAALGSGGPWSTCQGGLAGDNGGLREAAAHLLVQCPTAGHQPRRKPGEELWAVWRRNLDWQRPRY